MIRQRKRWSSWWEKREFLWRWRVLDEKKIEFLMRKWWSSSLWEERQKAHHPPLFVLVCKAGQHSSQDPRRVRKHCRTSEVHKFSEIFVIESCYMFWHDNFLSRRRHKEQRKKDYDYLHGGMTVWLGWMLLDGWKTNGSSEEICFNDTIYWKWSRFWFSLAYRISGFNYWTFNFSKRCNLFFISLLRFLLNYVSFSVVLFFLDSNKFCIF